MIPIDNIEYSNALLNFYTDANQSKKLREIIPEFYSDFFVVENSKEKIYPNSQKGQFFEEEIIPSFSLYTLQNLIPEVLYDADKKIIRVKFEKNYIAVIENQKYKKFINESYLDSLVECLIYLDEKWKLKDLKIS